MDGLVVRCRSLSLKIVSDAVDAGEVVGGEAVAGAELGRQLRFEGRLGWACLLLVLCPLVAVNKTSQKQKSLSKYNFAQDAGTNYDSFTGLYFFIVK